MRAAPPVTVVAVLSGPWWVGACCLWGLTATTLLAWLAMPWWHGGWAGWQTGGGLRLALTLASSASLVLAGANALKARRRAWTLCWDGSGWHCGPADGATLGEIGQVDLMMDAGNAVLLRWRRATVDGAGPSQVWLPLHRRGATDPNWHALRLALRWPPTGSTAVGGPA